MVSFTPRAKRSAPVASGQSTRRGIPEDGALDSTFAFRREGYSFISNRCKQLDTDIFRTRIMLTPVVCMRGGEAAAVFYSNGRFTRAGAMPRLTLRLLQDTGSVQLLDGAAHRRRKAMFMSMMGPEAISGMTAAFAREWRAALQGWQAKGRIVLHDELGEVITRAVMSWAGVPLSEREVTPRKRELTAMIEYAGSAGPANLWAGFLRKRAERWAARMIERVRSGEITPPDGSALAIIAAHTELDGQPLPEPGAAVELLNVLRPTVAVGRFIVFAAHALHMHPRWREAFARGDESDLSAFVQEVRRFYPFFPVIGGRVKQAFSWRNHAFEEGDWVLLDLYGTNHDPRIWDDPEEFRPERFRGWQGNPYTLIPQGGGGYDTGHRCPGEWTTIAMMQEAIRQLTRGMHYDVPEQKLDVRLNRMPALPESGFVMANVRPAS